MADVLLYEVGPRDGLQNEKKFVPTEKKIALVNALSAAGFQKIEVASFVSPKWVPQMADGAEVMAGIERKAGVTYAALTPNMRGYEGAKEAKADEVAIFVSASEGFSQKNINCSIDESFGRFGPILEAARANNIPVRGYLSCVVQCPYDGDIAPNDVAKVAERLLKAGCFEVSLGDTIGAGVPDTVNAMLKEVLKAIPAEKLAGHFHDTNDNALSNIKAAMEHGLTTFDSAIGGLGGCPYAPGAKGNVDTLRVHDMLTEEGVSTSLDRKKLLAAADIMAGVAL